jgi:hypothetical protein
MTEIGLSGFDVVLERFRSTDSRQLLDLSSRLGKQFR